MRTVQNTLIQGVHPSTELLYKLWIMIFSHSLSIGDQRQKLRIDWFRFLAEVPEPPRDKHKWVSGVQLQRPVAAMITVRVLLPMSVGAQAIEVVAAPLHPITPGIRLLALELRSLEVTIHVYSVFKKLHCIQEPVAPF